MKKNSGLYRTVYIYYGPTVPGVVSKYAVFTGEPPAPLKRLQENDPSLKDMIATTDEYPERKLELANKESALSVLYRHAQSELNRR